MNRSPFSVYFSQNHAVLNKFGVATHSLRSPISILTCFTKKFEKVIFNRLLNFFNKHSVLVLNQYGFRAVCSISHTILDILTSTYDSIDNNQYTGMVTLDITKAFDSVCHKRLLIKLNHYGIRGTAFKLMQSYLNNRLQYVYINIIESNRKSVGVLQGSVLDPLLCLIYINDLQNCLKSIRRLFADVTALLINASSIRELEIKIIYPSGE